MGNFQLELLKHDARRQRYDEAEATHTPQTHPTDFAYRRFIPMRASHDDVVGIRRVFSQINFFALFALGKRTKRNQKKAIRRRPAPAK